MDRATEQSTKNCSVLSELKQFKITVECIPASYIKFRHDMSFQFDFHFKWFQTLPTNKCKSFTVHAAKEARGLVTAFLKWLKVIP